MGGPCGVPGKRERPPDGRTPEIRVAPGEPLVVEVVERHDNSSERART